MRSALRKLCAMGPEALKPHKLPHTSGWAKPVVSKRVAKVIRKQALLNNTYGTFNSTTGIGWDSSWDGHVQNAAGAVGAVATSTTTTPTSTTPTLIMKTTQMPRLHPPKQTSRERTREARAKKIETLLEPVDEQIEQYYQRRADKKPPKTFENHFKTLVRRTNKR